MNELFEQAKNENIQLEVATRTTKENEISIFNRHLEKVSNSAITSYKIRAIIDHKTITINTEEINPTEIIQLIKENASISDNTDLTQFSEGTTKNTKILPESIQDYQKITADLLKINDIQLQYPNLHSLSLFYRHSYESITIQNEQTVMNDSNENHYFYCEMAFDFDGVAKSDYFHIISTTYDLKRFEEKLVERIEDTLQTKDGTSCKSGKYNILLDNESVHKILNAFSDMFFAEAIRQNKSVLSNRFNQAIFSDKITIVEDPTNDSMVGKRLFDDEGTSTSFKEIVKDGKLIQKLYNCQSAIVENTVSTGNSYGVRNLYIVPGKADLESMLHTLDKGIYITNVEGLHAGVNPKSGRISIQANGWMIENGKKVQALNMIILSTDLFELFSSVKEVGSDLEIFDKTGGAPSLLIENITIAGKE